MSGARDQRLPQAVGQAGSHSVVGKILPRKGDAGFGNSTGQLLVSHKLRQFFLELSLVPEQHYVLHIYKPGGAVLDLALVVGHQQATGRHGLEVLRHVLTKADIGRDEYLDARQGSRVVLAGCSTQHLQAMGGSLPLDERLAPLVDLGVQATNEAKEDVTLDCARVDTARVVALGHEVCIESLGD